MRFEIPFYGHQNIRSFHPKTIEITTQSELSLKGDCIIGVKASCGCNDLPESIKKLIRNSKSEILFTIIVNDIYFKIKGRGHDDLMLTNPHDIVIRKSFFICPRTLATCCNVAADAIPRSMIKTLQNPDSKGIFRIDVN